ncbi:MAG: flagellar hook-basal body protein [Oscillospiraceae bacterium]
MNISFYSSSVNAAAQQQKLDIIANNVANLNTPGFKKGNAVFTDLLYQNIRPPKENENTTIKNGSGVRIQQVTTDYSTAGIMETGNKLDFYIGGSGFFAVQDQATRQVRYTKDGSCYSSVGQDGKLYLCHKATDGLVLDRNGKPIVVEQGDVTTEVGIFDFANTEGFKSVGANMYEVMAKSGKPIVVDNMKAEQGKLEVSNAELSEEVSKMIVAQRSYSMNLKMLQVSDEIIQEVNKLR